MQPISARKIEQVRDYCVCVSLSQELATAVVRSCGGLVKEATSPHGTHQEYRGKEMELTCSDNQEGFQVIAKPPGQTHLA